MEKTSNIRLNAFPKSDWSSTKYEEFIKAIAGTDDTSNVQVLDRVIGELQNLIEALQTSKADLVDGKVPEEQLPEWVAHSNPSPYPIVRPQKSLDPEKYYEFGMVDELDIKLAAVNDGYAHEYFFEFTPSSNFTEIKISPKVEWPYGHAVEIGKTYQVSILRGMGVMVGV